MYKKALAIGLAGNEVSKAITGTSEVSPQRTLVATGSGAFLGACATVTLATTAGVVASPVVVPLTVASGVIAGVASLFD